MPVIATETLTRNVRPYFAETYKSMNDAIAPLLTTLLDLNVPSDCAEEKYAYFESGVHPEAWPYGQDVPEGEFASRSFTCVNLRWAKAVRWHEDDEADEQTSSLRTQVADLGRNFALLPERVAFQLIRSTTDAKLLPALPNAPDGAALFATTAGGAARFGASSGNLLTGTGVASTATVLADFFSVVKQFELFQDTQGEPMWPAELIARSTFVIIYGSANEQVFRQAFQQRIYQGTSAGLSNVILDAGLQFKLWSTPRETTNDWYVVLSAPGIKRPLFRQVRRDVQDVVYDENNSDRARDTGFRKWKFSARYGFGVALPFAIIKVDN